MIGLVSRQLQAEISLDRCADIRWAAVINPPAAVFILMAENVVGALLKALRIAGAKQRVQQNVVGLERGVGFEFAAPVAVLVLLGEKPIAAASIAAATRLAKSSIFPKRSCGADGVEAGRRIRPYETSTPNQH